MIQLTETDADFICNVMRNHIEITLEAMEICEAEKRGMVENSPELVKIAFENKLKAIREDVFEREIVPFQKGIEILTAGSNGL